MRKKGAKHLVISWKLDVFEVGSWISLDVAVDETFGRGYKAFGLDSWDLDSQSISLVWASSIGAGVVSAPHGPSFPALRFRMMGLGTASISFIGRSTRPLGHTWPVEPPKIRHPSFGTHEGHNMSHLDSRVQLLPAISAQLPCQKTRQTSRPNDSHLWLHLWLAHNAHSWRSSESRSVTRSSMP